MEYVSRAGDRAARTASLAWRKEVTIIVSVVCAVVVTWVPRVRWAVRVIGVVVWPWRVHASVRRAVLIVSRTHARTIPGGSNVCGRGCNGYLTYTSDGLDLCTVDALSVRKELWLCDGVYVRVHGRVSRKS